MKKRFIEYDMPLAEISEESAREKNMHEEKPCFRCSKAEFEYGRFPLEISGKKYGEFDGYRCPNCGILFFTEESSKQIREIISHLQMKINKISLDGDISDIPIPSRAGSLD